ncbi:MAG: hypothetical protein DFNUSKGM_000977 [Candidatus Fervidibacter sacchari]
MVRLLPSKNLAFGAKWGEWERIALKFRLHEKPKGSTASDPSKLCDFGQKLPPFLFLVFKVLRTTQVDDKSSAFFCGVVNMGLSVF